MYNVIIDFLYIFLDALVHTFLLTVYIYIYNSGIAGLKDLHMFISHR